MNLRLLSVGRPRDTELSALHDRYAERIRRMGVGYRAGCVAEVKPGSRYSDAHLKKREADNLRRALGPRVHVVALDAAGRHLDTPGLARALSRSTAPETVFVIGGPTGLDPDFRDAARWVWSLSRLTFPHEMVRVMVAEQLYRALTILRGLPYHK